MKEVYFVQANSAFGEKDKSIYIPYAVGCIAAYSFEDPAIKKEYTLGRFSYIKENIDTAMNVFVSPYLVGFSCSVWNTQYNVALAEKIKKRFPHCIVVFGGHNISPDTSTLEEYPHVDILIHGSGEETFKNLLIALSENKSLSTVANISYRKSGKPVSTKRQTPSELDYPSPYLGGYFADILKDDIKFSAIIETNRGCPENCAYCDWGELNTKIKFFPIEKVYGELEWLSENKIEYFYCADANFGLFDRDLDITNKVVSLKEETGYPQKLKVNFTNHRFDFLAKISKIFKDSGIGKAQTISFQSLSPVVLKNIGRKNLTLEHFRNLMVAYHTAEIPTYSELILGLPGETYESFTEGICTLLELGQHKSINVYPCELLPNSQMGNPLYAEKFGIKTVDTQFEVFHTNPNKSPEGIKEIERIIISTKTMSVEQWVKAYRFSTVIQGFHNLGLTRLIAMYLRHEKNLEYLDFYSNLIDYFVEKEDGLIHDILERLYNLFVGVAKRKNSLATLDPTFGEITYEPDETLFLNCAYRLKDFYSELRQFLVKYKSDGDLLEDVIRFQKSMVKLPFIEQLTLEFSRDFYSYFQSGLITDDIKPRKGKFVYEITDSSPVFSWEDYAREVVWYGRRDEGTLYLSKVTSVKTENN
ncbi:MAG: B12-binding domain-containing radical SAM protein [Acutalibacteraceae bacterium]